MWNQNLSILLGTHPRVHGTVGLRKDGCDPDCLEIEMMHQKKERETMFIYVLSYIRNGEQKEENA